MLLHNITRLHHHHYNHNLFNYKTNHWHVFLLPFAFSWIICKRQSKHERIFHYETTTHIYLYAWNLMCSVPTTNNSRKPLKPNHLKSKVKLMINMIIVTNNSLSRWIRMHDGILCSFNETENVYFMSRCNFNSFSMRSGGNSMTVWHWNKQILPLIILNDSNRNTANYSWSQSHDQNSYSSRYYQDGNCLRCGESEQK